MQTNYYDAIVVGSGMSGGWAAKELTESGLKTLVLERGRSVTHIKDYTTTNKAPWEFEYRQEPSLKTKEEYPKQQSVYAFSESTKHFFVKDKEHPYTNDEDKPFMWRRGYHTGGKSILWARQSYRLSQIDFEANLKDGHGVDWPVRYNDIAPWYNYVEKYIGVSGQNEGLKQLPDGEFLPPMDMNCVEEHFRDAVKDQFDGRTVTIGRCAHLTVPHNGRGPCQHRNMCETGCPYSGYFSSVSVTIPAAQKTGNLTLNNHSIVHSIIYDPETGKAAGVRVINESTKETTEYFAKVIFLCASTVATTQIMLNSKSESFPDGIANSSGALGHYMMDHLITDTGAMVNGFEDGYYDGHRPNGIYIPRFQNVDSQSKDFVRGYGYQGSASRESWWRGDKLDGFGGDFKDELMKPGQWSFDLGGFGEILPYYDNHMRLSEEADQWGIPLVHFSCELKENEKKMIDEIHASSKEMMESAGFTDVWHEGQPINWKFGDGIHEMGTARMGRDPKTSVLNKWNACHDVPNLFVTDGSFMASAGCQNPSLTYMAFTARAADYVIKQLKQGNL